MGRLTALDIIGFGTGAKPERSLGLSAILQVQATLRNRRRSRVGGLCRAGCSGATLRLSPTFLDTAKEPQLQVHFGTVDT